MIFFFYYFEINQDQASELIGAVENNWRQCERLKLLQQRQEMDSGLMQLLQQQLTAHSWIHDTGTATMNSASGLFIVKLRQALSVLLSQSPQLSEIHQQVAALAAQVEQRLRWASGANPNLQKVRSALHLSHLNSLVTISSTFKYRSIYIR